MSQNRVVFVEGPVGQRMAKESAPIVFLPSKHMGANSQQLA